MPAAPLGTLLASPPPVANNHPTLKIIRGRHTTEKPIVPRFLPAYELIGKIGEGRIGPVYLARHRLIKRDVAVRVMRRKYTTDPDTTRAFLTIAQAAAALRAHSTVEVYDLQALEGGGAYIVMELLRGQTLRKHLQQRGPFAVAEGLDLVLQISAGAQAAHDARITHGDLRPENIFLCSGTRTLAKIMDYGFSRLRSAADTTVDLQPAQGHDTIPSRSNGEHLQDLYALGEIFYEMFAGQAPYRYLDRSGRHDVRLTPPPLARIRPDLPRALVHVIDKLLQPWPSDRLRSARALMARVNDIAMAMNTPMILPRKAATERPPTLPPTAPTLLAGTATRVEQPRVPARAARGPINARRPSNEQPRRRASRQDPTPPR